MLKLTNIKLNNSVMSCDYYPEHTNLKGHIAYDMKTEEFIEYEPSAYPVNEKMYTGQVITKLHLLYKNKNDIPFEAYSVWY